MTSLFIGSRCFNFWSNFNVFEISGGGRIDPVHRTLLHGRSLAQRGPQSITRPHSSL